MFTFPLLTVLALAFVVWRIVARFKKKTKTEYELEKSLEDETIYVEGHGQISLEELGEKESEILKEESDDFRKEDL